MKTALYRHYDKDDILLYVGVSLSPISRLEQHARDAKWFEGIEKIQVEWHESRDAAYNAECLAIFHELPRHNKKIGFDRLESLLCQTEKLFGDPIAHKGDPRTEFIKIRVTQEERNAAEMSAKIRETTLSQLLREHLARLQSVDAKRADHEAAS